MSYLLARTFTRQRFILLFPSGPAKAFTHCRLEFLVVLPANVRDTLFSGEQTRKSRQENHTLQNKGRIEKRIVRKKVARVLDCREVQGRSFIRYQTGRLLTNFGQWPRSDHVGGVHHDKQLVWSKCALLLYTLARRFLKNCWKLFGEMSKNRLVSPREVAVSSPRRLTGVFEGGETVLKGINENAIFRLVIAANSLVYQRWTACPSFLSFLFIASPFLA